MPQLSPKIDSKLLAILGLSALLTACGGDSSEPEATEPEPTGEQTGGGGETGSSGAIGLIGGSGTEPTAAAAEECGAADGTRGTDPDSRDAPWMNNCYIQRDEAFVDSSYAQGIQRITWCLGYDDTDSMSDFADGSYGPRSEAAVEAFQTVNDITVDGIVGPETWDKLEHSLELLAEIGNRDSFGVFTDETEYQDCKDVVMFYEKFDPDTQLSIGWKMAAPDTEVEMTFSTGF